MNFTKYLRSWYGFAVCAVIITVLCEIFVFNFAAFKIGTEYTQITPDLNNAEINGFEKTENGWKSVSSTPNIEFKGINAKIGTVYLGVAAPLDSCVDYKIDFTDETNSDYRLRTNLVEGQIAQGQENTKYANCQFSGKVDKLKIKFTLKNDETIVINEESIRFNEDIPLDFSFIRTGIILLCAFLGYFLLKSKTASQTLSQAPYAASTVTLCVLIVALTASMLLTTGLFDKGIAQTNGNQITKELVDAFAQGKITLDRPVEEDLLALKNPYDWSERLNSGTQYAWDHVMYNGQYYSYYGIAPVILLFLPFYLLTGYYFSTAWAVFIFGAAGLVFLTLFYNCVCKRFFSKISVGLYTSSLLMILLGCGVWYCFITPNFYEIAQNSGFMFVCMGAYFLAESGILSEKVSNVKVCLSSVFFSLAVLSRPTTAVWCIAAVAFLAVGFFVLKKAQASFKMLISFAACALVPFAVIGAGQMIYNYARFGSFTDFGIQYSLTINDFTRAEFSIQSALIGFYNFLFAFPIVKPEYPFIFSNFSDLGINGYYFIANRTAIGQFFRILPMFSCFMLPKAVRTLEKEKKPLFTLLWLLCCAVLPFVVIFSIWESGYGVRYCVDFSWQMATGAFAILFVLYQKSENATVKRLCNTILAISLLLCAAVNIATIIEYDSSYVSPAVNASLKNTFEFWK